MIELKNLTKEYETYGLSQKALDDINIKFRENEFVSILGQSGSGKTTMLNIIGGLDRATNGDLLINGNSTKNYKDKNWDSYRNNSVGFVFQNYNLISHQSVLKNVELALTLSGVSNKEGREKAILALNKVGLKDHLDKKPNQLSGGQMQRVAIARALVNDPKILLADEPTGALDSETSIQIMDLLKEIANDRLVIMVTHNPELAKEYSTRIVELKDGKIISDTKPFLDNITEVKELNNKRTKMSFFTALSLSLNNLLTKKGRTLLTAFAGSIGIIGIALILSLSSGVNNYINNVQEDTLTSYPLTIEKKSQDLSKIFNDKKEDKSSRDKNFVYVNEKMSKMVSQNVQENDLISFKKYIETNNDKFKNIINDIQYSYDLNMLIFKDDENKQKVLPSLLDEKLNPTFEGVKKVNPMVMPGVNDTWKQMIDNDVLIKKQYNLINGKFPSKYNEVVIMLNSDGEINEKVLYSLGLKNKSDLDKLYPDEKTNKNSKEATNSNEEANNNATQKYLAKDLVGLKYKLILNSDLYLKKDNIWINKIEDKDFLNEKIKKGDELIVVGILKPKKSTQGVGSISYIGYTKSLSDYLIKKLENSEVINAQKKFKDTNIFTNTKFETNTKDKKKFDFKSLSNEEKIKISKMSPEELTDFVNKFNENINATYEENLNKLGAIDVQNPRSISFYPKSFEGKEQIKTIIENHNNNFQEGKNKDLSKVIKYTIKLVF